MVERLRNRELEYSCPPRACCWQCSEMSSALQGEWQRVDHINHWPVTVLLVTLNLLLEGRREVREENNYLTVGCFFWGLTKAWRVRGSEARDGFQSCFPYPGSKQGQQGAWTVFLMLSFGRYCGDDMLILSFSLGLKSSCLGSCGPVPLLGGWLHISYLTSRFLHLWNI